jgi:hypothetical protein
MSSTKINILSRVPGQYVSAALKTLPSAEAATDATLETVIDVPELGRLRFTCKRMSSKKGKSTNWFWCAESAVQE